MRTLRKDPSLRFSEAGRALLRWLDAYTVAGHAAPPADDIPAHCLSTVATLARHNARFWSALSKHLEELDQGDQPAAQAR